MNIFYIRSICNHISRILNSAYQRSHVSLLKNLGRVGAIIGQHSYALSYIDQVINGTVTPHFSSTGSLNELPINSWGYYNWERRLYEADVYSAWETTLECFVDLARHRVGFLLTPTTISQDQSLYFSKIEASLLDMNATHNNMYPELTELLGSGRQRSDWANPADGHPGSRQTSLYAVGALNLLIELGYSE